jgi:outer membrane autotransporter protein
VSLNNAIGSMTQAFGLQTLGTRAARYAEADAGPPMAGDLSAARRGDALRKTSLQPGGDGPGAGELTQNPERQGTHMWTRAFGEHGRVQGGGLQARGADFSYSSGGMQAGADLQVSRNGPIEDRVGGYAGFGNLHAEVRHFDGTLAGHNAMRAYAIGGYWGRTSEEGWYIDTVAQYTRYDKVRTMSVQGISSQTRGWGMAASVEAGKSFRLSPETSIEPQAQLIVQRTHLDDTRDSNATDIALGSANSVLGRLGARVVRKWFEPGSDVATHSTWLRLNAWQEFAGKSNATYQTANGPLSFGSNMRGTWGELELGFNASLSHSTSIFGTVGYQHSLGGTRREAASFSTGASTGGLAAMGIGLSMQLTPNARLTTKASYANAAKGQPNAIAANVALDLKW